MKLTLGNSWEKKLSKQINGFEFEVGVLDDKPHKNPVESKLFSTPDLTTYAGGPIRKTSRTVGEKSVGEILVENMERMNLNILAEPFRKKSSDILKFTDSFLRLATKRPGISIKRIENLLQAIVRNPILREEYGKNTATTADNKGFDRHLFDTGQLFKNIIARVTKRV